jgi:creatinine amidohydrolase
MYLYLDGDNVRTDKIKSGDISFNLESSPFMWVDLMGQGPATVVSWTSSYSETGVLGEPELATKEKGERAYKEAVKQLCRFVDYFRDRPIDARHAEQKKRTMPIPWGQRETL